MQTELTKSTAHRGKATEVLAASGLAAGLLASSCCVVPLLLLSVGISGAWISQLTALAPYQPIFIGAAAIALGLGFWRAYRRQDCAVGSICESPAVTRSTKAILWLGALVIVAAMSVNIVAPLFL